MNRNILSTLEGYEEIRETLRQRKEQVCVGQHTEQDTRNNTYALIVLAAAMSKMADAINNLALTQVDGMEPDL